MIIQIEFIGFPLIYDLFPEGRHRYSFEGKTIPQVVEDLIARNGQQVRESLLETGADRLDPTIQVRVNRRFVPKDEIPCKEIEDGDCITFLRLLAGG